MKVSTITSDVPITMETSTCAQKLEASEKEKPFSYVLWTKTVFTLRLTSIFIILFIYICTLSNLSNAFLLLGSRGLGKSIQGSPLISDPMSALIVGMLATIVLQSPTTTITVLVGMIAAEMISVHDAIPVMMGSELGSTVVNALVSLAYSGDPETFGRAFAAATLADVFNVCCLFVFLPLELLFGFIEALSWWIVDPLIAEQGITFKTMDLLTDPVNHMILQVNEEELRNATIDDDMYPLNHSFVLRCAFANGSRIYNCPHKHIFAYSYLSDNTIGWIVLVCSILTLILCLIGIVYLIQAMLSGKTGNKVSALLDKRCPGRWEFCTGYAVMLFGMFITMLIQSNSIFSSSLTPLVGSNVITLEQMYPLILGSNIGTTFSGVLAALSADGSRFEKTLQMAVCQVLYNVIGSLMFFIVPGTYRLPIGMAEKLGDTVARYRWFIVVFLLLFFLILPALIIALSLLPPFVLITVFIVVFVIGMLVVLIAICIVTCPSNVPETLKTLDWIPIHLRSLEPYDPWMTQLFSSIPVVGSFFQKSPIITEDVQQSNVQQLVQLNKHTTV